MGPSFLDRWGYLPTAEINCLSVYLLDANKGKVNLISRVLVLTYTFLPGSKPLAGVA